MIRVLRGPPLGDHLGPGFASGIPDGLFPPNEAPARSPLNLIREGKGPGREKVGLFSQVKSRWDFL